MAIGTLPRIVVWENRQMPRRGSRLEPFQHYDTFGWRYRDDWTLEETLASASGVELGLRVSAWFDPSPRAFLY